MAQNLSRAAGVVSANNTSLTDAYLPTVAAPYVGQWERNDDYQYVRTTMATDAPGAQFYDFYDIDGTTPDENTSPTSTYPVAGFPYEGSGFNEYHGGEKNLRWFRVRYVPTADATTFRINAYFVERIAAAIPLNQALAGDQDSTVVRAFSAAKTPAGDVVDLLTGGIDTQNSTQEQLDIAESFTGEYQQTAGMNSALAFALSDVQLDSVILQWSPDGVNARAGLIGTSALTEVEVGGFFIYISTVTTMVDQFVRLEVANGAAATTFFEADLWFYDEAFAGTFGGLEAPLSSLSTALLTRSIVAGYNPDQGFVNSALSGKSTGNTSTELLVAGGTFTGEWTPCANYDGVTVVINSDQNSAGNGVRLQFSEDQLEVVREVSFSYSSDGDANGRGRIYPAPRQGSFFRLEYQNGALGQNAFHATTFLSDDYINPAGPVTEQFGAGVISDRTSAIVVAEREDTPGQFSNVKQRSGGLNVNVKAFESGVQIEALDTWDTGQFNVPAGTAVQIAGSPIAGRKVISLGNLDPTELMLYGPTQAKVENNGGDFIPPLNHVEIPLSPLGQVWAMSGAAAGATNQSRRSGSSTTNSGATDPNNVLVAASTYAALSAATNFVDVTGYTSQGVFASTQTVEIGFIARKEAGQDETVTHDQTETDVNGSASTSMTIAGVDAATEAYYLAVVGFDNDTIDLASVVGKGLTWSELANEDCAAALQGHIGVFAASGDGTAGNVTLNYSGAAPDSSGFVSRISGVDIDGVDIGPITINKGSNNTATASGIVTEAGDKVYAAVFTESRDPSAVSGFTTLASPRTADSGVAGFIQNSPSAGGTESISVPLSGSGDWIVVAFALKQHPATDPIVTLSYDFGGADGPTESQYTLNSETDSEFTLDVTADEGFSPADIADIDVRVTADTVGSAAAEIKHIFIDHTEVGSGSIRGTRVEVAG